MTHRFNSSLHARNSKNISAASMPSKQKYVDVCKNNSEKARTFIFPTHASADLTNPDELASCRIILLFLHACMCLT
jgi:hypothetical protein